MRLWHHWKPRKTSAMNWLTLAGGLPVGEWRQKIGDSCHCKLYNNATRDTMSHAMVTCPHV
jgi:hypothetical protein